MSHAYSALIPAKLGKRAAGRIRQADAMHSEPGSSGSADFEDLDAPDEVSEEWRAQAPGQRVGGSWERNVAQD